MWRVIYKNILNFLFPVKCEFCGYGNTSVCEKCFEQIPVVKKSYDNIFSFYEYKDKKVDKLLWLLKYHHRHDIAKIFAKKISENIKFDIKNIFLIPIPLSIGDKRLHNHAEVFAKNLKECMTTDLVGGRSAAAQVQILPHLLIKNTKTKQAHTKSRQERFENIKGSFSISKNNLQLSQNNLFIIIDDVTTTGATINEARVILANYLQIPKNEILGLVIAH